MISAPFIIVQLVHIEGAMKGEIQEFSEPEISIGRHSSCHVRFPKDLTIISRVHARIVREGNRFKLIDQSANGTFLNGKRVKETFLKDGDVLIFADGGPKVSFLTKMTEFQQEVSPPPVSEQLKAQKPAIAAPPYHADKPPSSLSQPNRVQAKEIQIQKTQVPLIVQYGPTLRSFNELPITIGKNPKCDFIMDHPAILDHQAQIFYSQDQYWVKDLTGQNRILINGQPIQLKAPLYPENRLSLSSQGPSFRFLGAGRLAEIEETFPSKSDIRPSEQEDKAPKGKHSKKSPKGAGAILKKIFPSSRKT